MKRTNYKLYALSGLVSLSLLMGTGCSKVDDFGSINENPGRTTAPITSAVLTNVLAGIPGTAANTRGGLYAQYFSETQYTETSLYAEPKIDFDGTYAGPLNDLQNIINYNSDPETAPKAALNGSNNNQIAVARILKAYYFWLLTDQYGDIPYSEALKGEGATKFDSQQEIYTDLFKELTEAVAQFDNGLGFKGDLMYGGDNAKWKKFANSLRLLMALRISKADATTGAAQASAAIAAGVMTSNDDNATIDYPNDGTYNNVWWGTYNTRKDFAMSDIVDDFVTDLNDPRKTVFGSSDIGFPYGLTRDAAVAFDGSSGGRWARILSDDKRTSGSPVVIVNYATVLLAQAEARQRGWINAGPSAEDLYKMAIKASWDEWELNWEQETFDTYYGNADVDLAAAGDPLEKIAIQRYLAMYPNGSQAWFEWRRTGFPVLEPTPFATNSSKQIPRRYVYGLRQYSLNKANVEAAAAAMGGDTQDSRVWWDKP
jgi:hypothetical protein